jgi:hypothetical protein
MFSRPPPAQPPGAPPERRRSKTPIVVAAVVVLALAGAAGAFVLTRGNEGSPVEAADPSDAAEPSASPGTPSPGASPEAEPDDGSVFTVQGIEIRLSSATRKEQYVSGTGAGQQIFSPTLPGDIFLIVRGTFEGGSNKVLDLKVAVIDENGRRDTPSISSTTTRDSPSQGKVEWVIAVSQASDVFTFQLPGGVTFDLTPLLA